MKTIRLQDELSIFTNTPIRIDATCWESNEDTFKIATWVWRLRNCGVKKIVLFIPRLPYYYWEQTPEWYVFCEHINILRLNAIETYSSINDNWSEGLLRVFQVKNNGFIQNIMDSGDFILSTNNGSFFEKNVLYIVESFNFGYIMHSARKILKEKPRTINLVCKHFDTVKDQRDALEIFDRVFTIKLDKYYVEGIEQIPYGEE